MLMSEIQTALKSTHLHPQQKLGCAALILHCVCLLVFSLLTSFHKWKKEKKLAGKTSPVRRENGAGLR